MNVGSQSASINELATKNQFVPGTSNSVSNEISRPDMVKTTYEGIIELMRLVPEGPQRKRMMEVHFRDAKKLFYMFNKNS